MYIPELTTRTWIIIATLVILCIVISLIILYYRCNKYKNTKKGKPCSYPFLRYSGLFRKVSSLNIGHTKNAPIFHARPWLGKDFHSGIGEYMGAFTLPKDRFISITFPKLKIPFEVNVIRYPQWEHIGESMYCPSTLNIGYTMNSDIVLDNPHDEFIIILTGMSSDTQQADTWLEQCQLHVLKCKKNSRVIQSSPVSYVAPVQQDISYSSQIEKFYDNYINIWLGMNPDYDITHNIIAANTDISFPPTGGIIKCITYTPESTDETIFIIYPNRKFTLGIESAIYVEIDGQRMYLKQTNNDVVAGVFSYDVVTLSTIYVEERILTSPESNILPFSMYIANPTEE